MFQACSINASCWEAQSPLRQEALQHGVTCFHHGVFMFSFSQGLGIRRLGLLSNGCSSGGDVRGEGEENPIPTAVVEVSFVSLVVEKGRREGDGDGVMREEEEEEEEQTGVKNFKKFRKVYSTCIWRVGKGGGVGGLEVVTTLLFLWLAVAK